MEYARTFLMSHCFRPMVAAKSAVTAPTRATVSDATGAIEKSIELRATRKTPAVTIVAAWISAETGVGPAIASGNQTKSGICALLPAQPRNRKRQMAVTTIPPAGSWSALAAIVV